MAVGREWKTGNVTISSQKQEDTLWVVLRNSWSFGVNPFRSFGVYREQTNKPYKNLFLKTKVPQKYECIIVISSHESRYIHMDYCSTKYFPSAPISTSSLHTYIIKWPTWEQSTLLPTPQQSHGTNLLTATECSYMEKQQTAYISLGSYNWLMWQDRPHTL